MPPFITCPTTCKTLSSQRVLVSTVVVALFFVVGGSRQATGLASSRNGVDATEESKRLADTAEAIRAQANPAVAFKEWKVKYEKSYPVEDEALVFSLWRQAVDRVVAINSDNSSSHWGAVNEFADHAYQLLRHEQRMAASQRRRQAQQQWEEEQKEAGRSLGPANLPAKRIASVVGQDPDGVQEGAEGGADSRSQHEARSLQEVDEGDEDDQEDEEEGDDEYADDEQVSGGGRFVPSVPVEQPHSMADDAAAAQAGAAKRTATKAAVTPTNIPPSPSGSYEPNTPSNTAVDEGGKLWAERAEAKQVTKKPPPKKAPPPPSPSSDGASIFGLLPPDAMPSDLLQYLSPMFTVGAGVDPPSSMDWVKEGVMRAVRNQGSCGTCWAHAAATAIEAAANIQVGISMDFSIQQLVDCSEGTYCGGVCNCMSGGWPVGGLVSVIKKGGISKASDYPMKCVNDPSNSQKCVTLSRSAFTCQEDASYPPPKPQVYAKVVSAVSVAANEADLMQAVGTKGPVAISVRVGGTDLASYSGGILSETYCQQCVGKNHDHAVTLVGYDKDSKGVEYWLIRNSWGSKWGESGHYRVKKGINCCNIGYSAVYPIVTAVSGNPTSSPPPSPAPKPPPSPTTCQNKCGTTCCASGTVCVSGQCRTACGSGYCSANQNCLSGNCCSYNTVYCGSGSKGCFAASSCSSCCGEYCCGLTPGTGQCCSSSAGGNFCCKKTESCCGNGNCCKAGQYCCGGKCCDYPCCGSSCLAAGQSCCNGVPCAKAPPPSPRAKCGGTTTCSASQYCFMGKSCCSTANTAYCGTGSQGCLNPSSCPSCCGEYCCGLEVGTGTCCSTSYGSKFCCKKTESCCGDGKCCKAGQYCCGGKCCDYPCCGSSCCFTSSAYGCYSAASSKCGCLGGSLSTCSNGACCLPGAQCCSGNGCCSAGYRCCTTTSKSNYCCPTGSSCCNNGGCCTSSG